MTAASPLGLYREAVERHGFAPDESQQSAAARLDACFQALHGEGAVHPRRAVAGVYLAGVYLWGPVGRGKTWLMDGFHRQMQLARFGGLPTSSRTNFVIR